MSFMSLCFASFYFLLFADLIKILIPSLVKETEDQICVSKFVKIVFRQKCKNIYSKTKRSEEG